MIPEDSKDYLNAYPIYEYLSYQATTIRVSLRLLTILDTGEPMLRTSTDFDSLPMRSNMHSLVT